MVVAVWARVALHRLGAARISILNCPYRMDPPIGRTASLPPQLAPHVFQLAYLVEELERSIARIGRTLGAGPFYVIEASRASQRSYRGRPNEESRHRIALALLGPVQIELIQHISGEGVYLEFIDKHGYGFHHLGVDAPAVEDYDRMVQLLESQGCHRVQWGATAGGTRFAYMDTGSVLGGYVEIVFHGPDVKAFFERLQPATV